MMNRFSQFRIICLLLAVACSAIWAQEPPEKESFKPGRQALQFEVGRNLSLSDFQGSTLSYRRQTSATSAWQIGVSLSGNFSTGEGTEKRDVSAYDSLDIDYYVFDTSKKRRSLHFGLVSQRLKYSQTGPNLYFIRGVGPILSVDYSFAEDQLDIKGDYIPRYTHSYRISRRKRWTIATGISGIVGAEWFLTSQISLMAAYFSALNMQYGRDEILIKSVYQSRTELRDTNYPEVYISNVSHVRLGLSGNI